LQSRRMAGLKFFRQYSVGPYILDFYCPERRLAIEIDGGQHADVLGRQHDAHRDGYLKELNIRVIRFWNPDKSGQNINGVGEGIKKEAKKH
jgi:very-short-patch-repair endonuclease